MCDDGHTDSRDGHEADGEQPDRSRGRPQLAKRREEGRAVEERRQDAEEDELGLSSNSGMPGTIPMASPPSTSRIGYGIRSAGATASIVATARMSPSATIPS